MKRPTAARKSPGSVRLRAWREDAPSPRRLFTATKRNVYARSLMGERRAALAELRKWAGATPERIPAAPTIRSEEVVELASENWWKSVNTP